ncbi:MAG: thioredoxin family protein [Planctomycetota bacterium]|jgi:thioredoxin 1
MSMTKRLSSIVWLVGLALVACGAGCQAGASGQFVDVADEQHFDQTVLEDDRPVLVEFYRDGCIRCVMLAGTLSDLSNEYGDRVGFYKVERTSGTLLRYRYGVGSYPSVILFVNGKERARWVAEGSKAVYRQAIEAAFVELDGGPADERSDGGRPSPPAEPISRPLSGCSLSRGDGENGINSRGLCSEY